MLECGLYLLVFTTLLGVASPFAGRLVGRWGAVHVLVGGSLLTAVGFAYMGLWHQHPYNMMISLGLAGLGFGLTLPTLFTAVVHAVPPKSVGEVSGISSVLRFVGGAVATQVITSLVTSSSGDGLPPLFRLHRLVLGARRLHRDRGGRRKAHLTAARRAPAMGPGSASRGVPGPAGINPVPASRSTTHDGRSVATEIMGRCKTRRSLLGSLTSAREPVQPVRKENT